MATNDYVFLTQWRVAGTVAEVYDVLIDGVEFQRWWPEVYLKVDETDCGGEHGLGKAARLLTKGKLPYRLRWQMEVVEVEYPHGFTIEATGDFVGCGVWRFRQDGGEVDVNFDWRLRAEKPLLRYLSFLFKPLFAANHRWAMARGIEHLPGELQRRRRAAAR